MNLIAEKSANARVFAYTYVFFFWVQICLRFRWRVCTHTYPSPVFVCGCVPTLCTLGENGRVGLPHDVCAHIEQKTCTSTLRMCGGCMLVCWKSMKFIRLVHSVFFVCCVCVCLSGNGDRTCAQAFALLEAKRVYLLNKRCFDPHIPWTRQMCAFSCVWTWWPIFIEVQIEDALAADVFLTNPVRTFRVCFYKSFFFCAHQMTLLPTVR